VPRQEFVGSLIIDVRERDDTAQVAETVGIGALMIGGRGNDTLMGGIGGDILKGNDNRDSLADGAVRTPTRVAAAATTCRHSTGFTTRSSRVAMAR
jgi:Ca2+-binding RTX toxin-like protein